MKRALATVLAMLALIWGGAMAVPALVSAGIEVPTFEEFQSLEARVEALEGRVSALEADPTPSPEPSPSESPTPDPSPTETPSPTGPTGTPTTPPPPPPTETPAPGTLPGPEPVGPGKGVFSVSCDLDHQAKDDPVVFPGQTGAAHIHDFFGAVGVDAFSTQGTGGTTCEHIADRAAYWAPALIGPNGETVRPTNLLAYYQAGRAVRAIPQGLVMIADIGGHPDTGFGCDNNTGGQPTPDIQCSNYIKMHVHFPFCWDGVNLDSPDHRSHMSYGDGNGCDAAHPVEIVHLHVHVQYRGLKDGTGYHLAPNADGSIPGVHADFVNHWDQAVLERIVAECINAGVDCKKNTTAGL